MIVRSLVVAHRAPVARLRSGRGVRVFLRNLTINPLRIGPLFFFKRDSPQTHLELRLKFVLRQIPFDAVSLDAFRIEDQYRRRPGRVEAMEPRGVFLDMRLDRKKIRVDEVRDASIRVRLGLQPSACASSRGRAEIQKNRPVAFTRLRQRGIDVFAPLNLHVAILVHGQPKQESEITEVESTELFPLPAAESAAAAGFGTEVRRTRIPRRRYAVDRLFAIPSKKAERDRSLTFTRQVEIVHFDGRDRFVKTNLGMHHRLPSKNDLGFEAGVTPQAERKIGGLQRFAGCDQFERRPLALKLLKRRGH